MAVRIWHIVMVLYLVMAYDGQLDGAAFSSPRVLAGKTFAGRSQALVPRPRRIRFGEERPVRKGNLISIRATVTPEDHFAVDELASAPSKINGKRVPVVSNGTAARILVLDRTGAVDAVSGRDDQP